MANARMAANPPEKLSYLFDLINMVIKNGHSNDYSSDIRSIRFADLIRKHKSTDGNTILSFAGWARATNNQAVLDYIYQLPRTDFYEQRIGLHWAIACNQPDNEIKKQIELTHQTDPTDKYPTIIRLSKDLYALDIAVMLHDLERVELLLKNTTIHLAGFDRFHNALHTAMEDPDLKIIATLLNTEMDVNRLDERRNTPAHILSGKNHKNAAEILKMLNEHADFDASIQNLYGNTIMHLWLNHHDNLDIFKEIDLDMDVNIKNNGSQTLLSLAVLNSYNALVDEILSDTDNAHFSTPSKYTLTDAFHAACFNGNNEAIELLLPHVDLASEFGEYRSTGLYVAAERKQDDTVKLLCQKRIELYINERSKVDEHIKTIKLFGKSRGLGYSKLEKIEAANALLDLVNGVSEPDQLEAHMKALRNSSLGDIYYLVNKFCLETYHPPRYQKAL